MPEFNERLDGARVVEVIEVTFTRNGPGKIGVDIVRSVKRYYDKSGELLAERDDWARVAPES